MEKTLKQANGQVNSETMFFSNALKQILSDFSSRSQEIIFARYGVFSLNSLTLEEIGKKYHITRERVRQVIHEVLRKVRENKNDAAFLKVQEAVVFAIRSNGGIMEEKRLLAELGKGNKSEDAAISFFLECIGEIICSEIKGELKFSCALGNFDFESWRKVKNDTVKILEAQKKPFAFNELFASIETENKSLNLSKEAFAHYLEVSEEIDKNAFGKWGIAQWKEISPKGTREKAYLILKEVEKPLHFRDIAKKIDEHHLNKKKTHPQTVHNELIKDKNFVLVGRGIYALAEWGYRKGTVKDVIEEILKKSEQPLKREEILSKVLEIRRVKKSTIIINLNNFFSKSKNGTYSIKK